MPDGIFSMDRRNLILGMGASGLVANIYQPTNITVSEPEQGQRRGIVQLSPGLTKIEKAYILSGYGQFFVSGGASHIEGIGSTGSIIIGAEDKGWDKWFVPLNRVAKKGSNVIYLGSVSGYRIGQVLFLVSGRSSNSSRGNPISKNRQFATIVEIDTGNNTIKLSSPLEQDIDPLAGGMVTRHDTPVAVNCTIQNVRLGSLDTPGVIYSHTVQFSYVVSIRDVFIEGNAATGFVANSDHVIYDNVAFVGYSGISCARGVRKVVWRDCSYSPRPKYSEGYCAFIEESPESAIVENFRARGGQFKIANCSDEDVDKLVFVKNIDLVFDGVAVRSKETMNVPAVEVAFAASRNSMVTFEGGMIRTPGGNRIDVGKSVPRCAVYLHGSRRVRLQGLRFAGLAADAYAIALDGASCFEIEIVDCSIVDGSGLGLCHPSVMTNLYSDPVRSTMCRMDALEVAIGSGRVRMDWDPDAAEIVAHWPGRIWRGTHRLARISSASHHHLLTIEGVVGGRAGFVPFQAIVDVDASTLRIRSLLEGARSELPLRVVRNGDTFDVMLAVPDDVPWQATLRYRLPPVDDGRHFALA